MRKAKTRARARAAPPLKLNLGAGTHAIDGYTPIDRKTGGEAYPLAYADGTVDEIRASHVLEHFSHRDTQKVLKEWARVLRPGGVLKVAVPNFEWIAENYIAGKLARYQLYTMGGHVDADDHHGAMFDPVKLFNHLEHAGFTDIEPWTSEIADCASLPVSLNLMGRKAVTRDIRVECAMSVPRLGFMSNFFCWAQNLLQPFGIAPSTFDGAFWGQCLEKCMEKFADESDPPDYILTVDYDSFFDVATVRRLLRTAINHPEADAIAPIQVKRGTENVPLMGLEGGAKFVTDETFAPWLTKARTAHFGLTLLKTSALQKMPHPWFLAKPDTNGRWGGDHTDEDISFWHKWAETGNSLYIANRCTVGHGEYVVMWPDRQFNVIHQPTNEFRTRGMPAGVWR